MKSKIIGKPEKIVGYVLLVVGIIVVITLHILASQLFSQALLTYQKYETLVLSDAKTPMNNATIVLPISTADINEIIEKTFPAVDLGLFIALSVILISAGSVVMGKGVGLIKQIKLRTVRAAVKEISGEIKVEEKEKAKRKEK